MDSTTYFHTKATMSCFIDIDIFNNSYYYDFHVETEDIIHFFLQIPLFIYRGGVSQYSK